MAKRKISIMMGQITAPLKRASIDSGTTLGELLKRRKLAYSSAVRVSGNARGEDYVLRPGDLVTFIEEVTGG